MSERGLDELFSACGVSHLVAVSGGHLVLVSAVVSALLRRTRLGTLPRALTLLGATALFVAFCGAPVSAVRSWVMVLAAELSRLAGRRAHPLSSASVTALAMAALEPGVTGQLGFVLSVACVCGICALGGYARYVLRVLVWRSGGTRGHVPVRAALSSAQEALALTVVSQAVTMPFTCATFGTLSLVAPLANVLLAPLFSLVLVLGLAVALLAWAPPLQALVLVPCDAVGTAVVRLARRLAGLPLACVPVSVEEGPALALLGILLAALLVVWPRVTRRALVGALCAALALGLAWHLRWRLFAPACVRVLDVGQGDAILVTDGSSSLLVDTGPGDAVVGACARNNVTHLDAILVTHLHDDHVGGVEALRGVVSVGEVIVAEGVTLEAGDVPVSTVGRGDVVRVGRFSLEVLSPSGPVDGLENEDSVVCSLSYEDQEGRTLHALLTGDAERDVTDTLVEAGDVGDVDLLKVGHHGSEVSVSEGAAAALMPEVSVASAGEGNAYGHPDPACVEILEDVGSTFLCTMDVGDVCVEPGVEGPVVSCQRGSVRDATLR
nr:ComEC/Rec2 family competence protein [Thermophilibacter gallinarum]